MQSGHTVAGQILGTAAYMSPEQAEGKPIDHRSDIFSLGILLYEMASGRRPFEGDTQISTITSVLRDTPPPVTEISQNCRATWGGSSTAAWKRIRTDAIKRPKMCATSSRVSRKRSIRA